jgi:GlpG protein
MAISAEQPPETAAPAHRYDGPPILTWVVCGLCVLLTVAYHTSVRMPGTWWYALGQFGVLPVEGIWSGKYTALFTSVFVHGSHGQLVGTLMHIGFNLLWLFVLGRYLEEALSPAAWVLFFISAAVVASAAEVAVSSHGSVGVSGIVYAMFGLMWAGREQFPEWKEVATAKNLQVFVGWGLMCIAMTMLKWFSIANAAHFGGLFFGLAVGWLFIARRNTVLAGVMLVVLLAGAVVAVKWMPWSARWLRYKGDLAAASLQFEEAEAWYRQALMRGGDPIETWNHLFRLFAAQQDYPRMREAQWEILRLRGLRALPNAVPPTEPPGGQ